MTQPMNIQAAFQEVMAASGDIPPKQKQVLAASLDLFAEQGFANTTTKEIAARAGVAEGTVYRRYKTKDALLAAVLAPFMTGVLPKLVADFTGQLASQTYLTRHDLLATVVADRLAFIKDNRAMLRVLVTEFMVRSDLREQVIPRILSSVQSSLFQVLDRLKASGELVDWPNDRIAQFVIGTMVTEMLRSLFTGEAVEETQSLIIDFLEKGLAPN